MTEVAKWTELQRVNTKNHQAPQPVVHPASSVQLGAACGPESEAGLSTGGGSDHGPTGHSPSFKNYENHHNNLTTLNSILLYRCHASLKLISLFM